MSNPFDATASMLGYLFQCRLALHDAIRRLKRDGSFSVAIETLDDVVFEADGSPTELLQAKHHVNRTGGLGDASPDLWKSIRIWAEGHTRGRWPSDTLHYLITTGTAQEGSIAAYLRNAGQRDAERARERLDSVAQTSENDDTKPARAAYLALSPAERLSLLDRVVISDRSPDIAAVGGALYEELALTVRRELVGALVTRLEGWWFQRVVEHLLRESDAPIASEELDAELHRIRQQFDDDNLPIDPDLLDVEIDPEAFSSHVFVEQLRLIDLTNKRIITAMRQYFRASEQRSRWLREGFLLFGELKRYDRLLCEEWEIRFDAMAQDLGEGAAEAVMRKAAQELYGWAERDASFPIRLACREPFVTRGSLQILSDGRLVGWHPEFFQRLEGLLVEEEAP